MTETWLHDGIPTETINIAGFICHCRVRSNDQTGGGVICYVKNNWLLSLEQDDLEMLWLFLRGLAMPRHVSHILVGVVYQTVDQ